MKKIKRILKRTIKKIINWFGKIDIKQRVKLNKNLKKCAECEFDLSGKTVDIFGSCVSRDLLEICTEKNFSLGTYVSRESIVSAVSIPIGYSKEDIQLTSPFQLRMLEFDLKKEALQKLRESKSEYLIIDLIDERFDVGKLGDSYFTISNELTVSKVLEKKEYEVIQKNDNFEKSLDKPLEEYLDMFCDIILEIYEPKNIILHKAIMVNYYVDNMKKVKRFSEQYLPYNKRINKIIKKMYAYLEKRIPEAIVVDICEQFCADENHKWGLAPKHYRKEYYVSVLNDISKKIISES